MKFLGRNRAQASHKKRNWLLIGMVFIIIGLVASAGIVRNAYQNNLRPLSSSEELIVVTIEPGTTPNGIANSLKTKGVIKSDWAFEWYIRNQNLGNKLKAGTYVFRQSQSIQEIVDQIVSHEIATDLVTILPGQRIDQIRESLIKDGFKASEVDEALKPENYRGHSALTDKPKNATLEGYLYPESFQKTGETKASQIIEKSLNEMSRRLTPEIRLSISEQGLSVHQAITLASLVEGEAGKPEDQARVAQVFYKRLAESMKLESNATDQYAKIDSAYNTYKIEGLPPGPVSNFGLSALEAVASPAKTDWLYFVSGDGEHSGSTYFSKTLQEHKELTKKYCSKCTY